MTRFSWELAERSWVKYGLGLSGRTAIVCAASKGLGRAVAFALAREGVNLVTNARDSRALQETNEQIRSEARVSIISVVGDITTTAVQNDALAACPDPDILINNGGGPTPGDFRNVQREDWICAVEANMLTPIELIRRVIDGRSPLRAHTEHHHQ